MHQRPDFLDNLRSITNGSAYLTHASLEFSFCWSLRKELISKTVPLTTAIGRAVDFERSSIGPG